MTDFAHLHLHTQYSILDGASSIPELIRKVKTFGMKAVAITDHGNMFGVKEFHNEARKEGIKPILGCEVYVAGNSRFNKDKKEDRAGCHLILLAKNLQGYKNLIKMVSLAWIEGHYYKPRIDKELLRKYNDGIIASSACLGGELPSVILNQGNEKAEEVIKEFMDIFGDDYYLELVRHQTDDPEIDSDTYARQVIVNKNLVELSKKFNIKLIATNDVHFINAEDAEAHDRLICLNTGKDLDDPDRLRYTKQEFLKTPQEMSEIFSDIPEALGNTLEIVEKIDDYELNQAPVMPDFPIPEGFEDENNYLRHLSYEGAKERYDVITDKIKERIDFELSVIQKMGYPGYFLIVQDFISAARKMGVSVGPGRGSAAGSVVSYCTRITDIDPLKYNLLFERFLNPDRISMPDIDIDFDEDGRDQVLKWVVDKYGQDHVAHIITFGTMAAKMAIRDVGRIQKLPLSEADRLAKLVPERPGITLKTAYKEVQELRAARTSGSELVSQTLKFAEILEGSVRHTGLHACGIIIGKNKLIDHLPISTSKDSSLLVTQFDGNHVEDVGMLKMDLLGLKTLSIIGDAVVNIKESKGIDIDINNIHLDDEKTYELYSRGDTTGLFQFESAGMKKYLRELKPNRFEDLIAMNALYRPGPMEHIPRFIYRKHGQEKIHYELPVMEEYLKDTYGITVYQEQVMQLSQAMAGFSRGQADSLRKAMGKKKKKVMDELREKFFEGCRKNGYDEKIVGKIWLDWEAFAEYAFNKSHSTCYAFISYQTAYLKAHFPSEYMAAVLSRNINDIKKITIFMDETKRMGIFVFGPDVNESNIKFTVNKDGNILFGLGAIKGMGSNAARQIMTERKKNGSYNDIYDFAGRVNLLAVNKKNFEALALAGAFDNFKEITRGQFFGKDSKGNSFVENLIRYGNKIRNEKSTSQKSLFGEEQGFEIKMPEIPQVADWSKLEKLNKEKEVIGIFLSAHPLDDFRLEIDQFCNTSLAQLNNPESLKEKELTVAGIVSDIRQGTTRKGKPFGILTLQDYTDTYRLAMFNTDYINYSKYFAVGYFLLIKGRIQPKYYNKEELEFKVKKIHLLPNVREELINTISLEMPISEITPEFIDDFDRITLENKGKTTVKFNIYDNEGKYYIEMFSRTRKVYLSDSFINFLDGKSNIEFKLN